VPSRRAPVVPIDSGSHQARVFARRDALVARNLRMVDRIARKVHKGLPPSFELADLIGTGRFWLLRAATRYRPSEHGETPFRAFAWPIVHGAIVESVRRKCYSEHTRAPLDPENEPASIPDFESTIDVEKRSRAVALAIDCLPERQKHLIELYFGPAEPSLRAVAKELNCSFATVRRDRDDALDRLRMLLGA
jgi:RNA polymerase sigma factor (sigma-70 family)